MEHGGAKRWPEARDKMREALKLKKSYDVAGNLGLVEAELEDWRAAAEHLHYARSVFPMKGKPESRERIERVLAEAKSKVGCFSIKVSVDGAQVRVGDREVGSTPIGDLVCGYPGPATVDVTRDGYRAASEPINLAMGGETSVSITLVPAKDEGTGKGETDPRPLWPTFLLGGVALAGVGAGIGLVVAGSGKYGEAEETCTSATADCIAAQQSFLDEADTLSAAGIVSFGVGGAALVGTLLYLLVPGGPGNPTTSAAPFRLLPTVGPGVAALTFTAEF